MALRMQPRGWMGKREERMHGEMRERNTLSPTNGAGPEERNRGRGIYAMRAKEERER